MTLKKILLFAIGPLGLGILGIITVPILTWSFSMDDIGRFTMLQTIISFMCLILGLGLDQAFVREFYETDCLASLLKHTFFPGFILLIAVFILLAILQIDFAYLLFGISGTHIFWFTAVCVLSTFVGTFCSYILRMQERGFEYSLSLLSPKIFFLLLLGVIFFNKVDKSFNALLVIQTVSLLLTMCYLVYITKDVWADLFKVSLARSKLKPLLLYGAPLVLGSLSYWGLTSVDRVVLRSLSTFDELGKYSVAVNFAAVGIMFNKIFSTVWLPIIYRWVAEGIDERKVDAVVDRVLAFVVFAFSIIGIFSWVIDFILPQSYSDVKFLVVSCLGFPLLYALSETTVVGVNVSRKTIYSMFASAGALVINLISNSLLTQKFGAAGAAVSTSFGFFTFLILRTEFSVLVWRSFPRAKMYFFTFSCVAISAIESLFHDYLNNYIYFIWMFFFVVCTYSFRDILFSLLKFKE